MAERPPLSRALLNAALFILILSTYAWAPVKACADSIAGEQLPPITAAPSLGDSKSPLKFAFVGFSPLAEPSQSVSTFPRNPGLVSRILLALNLGDYLTEAPTLYWQCNEDFTGYDVLIVSGCRCVAEIRAANPQAIIGAANARYFVNAGPTPEARCLPALDFVVADSRAMQQRLESNGVPSIFLRMVETPPVPLESLRVAPVDTLQKGLHLCMFGGVQDLAALKAVLLDDLTKRRLGVETFGTLVMDSTDVAAIKDMLGVPNLKIKVHAYDHKSMYQQLAGCTIGLVPSIGIDVGECPAGANKADCFPSELHWSYNMTANAGPAAVFLQLGIPVVAAAIPEASEIIGANKLGVIVEPSRMRSAWPRAVLSLVQDNCRRKLLAERSFQYAQEWLHPRVEAQKLLIFSTKLLRALGRGSASKAHPDSPTGERAINRSAATKDGFRLEEDKAAPAPDFEDGITVLPVGSLAAAQAAQGLSTASSILGGFDLSMDTSEEESWGRNRFRAGKQPAQSASQAQPAAAVSRTDDDAPAKPVRVKKIKAPDVDPNDSFDTSTAGFEVPLASLFTQVEVEPQPETGALTTGLVKTSKDAVAQDEFVAEEDREDILAREREEAALNAVLPLPFTVGEAVEDDERPSRSTWL